jgi:hypothetical protein
LLCQPLLLDGKQENFQVWGTRLEAYVGVFGFLAAMQQPGGETDMPSTESIIIIDETTKDGKKESGSQERKCNSGGKPDDVFHHQEWNNGLHLQVKV